jgi:hypothetical protein
MGKVAVAIRDQLIHLRRNPGRMNKYHREILDIPVEQLIQKSLPAMRNCGNI